MVHFFEEVSLNTTVEQLLYIIFSFHGVTYFTSESQTIRRFLNESGLHGRRPRTTQLSKEKRKKGVC